MCVVRRKVGAQVYSVVRWLFGCGLVVGGFDCANLLSFLAMPGLCCFLRVSQHTAAAGAKLVHTCSYKRVKGRSHTVGKRSQSPMLMS